MAAQMVPLREESVGVMGQRSWQLVKHAAMRDAPTLTKKEKSACSMVQNRLKRHAAMKDVPNQLVNEDSVSDMGQLSKLAAMKNAPKKSVKEDSVGGMERRRGKLEKLAATKDALTLL